MTTTITLVLTERYRSNEKIQKVTGQILFVKVKHVFPSVTIQNLSCHQS